MKSGTRSINTKQLRSAVAAIIEEVREGRSYLVLYRNKPAFQIVQPKKEDVSLPPLAERSDVSGQGAGTEPGRSTSEISCDSQDERSDESLN